MPNVVFVIERDVVKVMDEINYFVYDKALEVHGYGMYVEVI